MYNVRASGNPSSWAGPIWINVNYLVFKGLLQYGYEKEARQIQGRGGHFVHRGGFQRRKQQRLRQPDCQPSHAEPRRACL